MSSKGSDQTTTQNQQNNFVLVKKNPNEKWKKYWEYCKTIGQQQISIKYCDGYVEQYIDIANSVLLVDLRVFLLNKESITKGLNLDYNTFLTQIKAMVNNLISQLKKQNIEISELCFENLIFTMNRKNQTINIFALGPKKQKQNFAEEIDYFQSQFVNFKNNQHKIDKNKLLFIFLDNYIEYAKKNNIQRNQNDLQQFFIQRYTYYQNLYCGDIENNLIISKQINQIFEFLNNCNNLIIVELIEDDILQSILNLSPQIQQEFIVQYNKNKQIALNLLKLVKKFQLDDNSYEFFIQQFKQFNSKYQKSLEFLEILERQESKKHIQNEFTNNEYQTEQLQVQSIEQENILYQQFIQQLYDKFYLTYQIVQDIMQQQGKQEIEKIINQQFNKNLINQNLKLDNDLNCIVNNCYYQIQFEFIKEMLQIKGQQIIQFYSTQYMFQKLTKVVAETISNKLMNIIVDNNQQYNIIYEICKKIERSIEAEWANSLQNIQNIPEIYKFSKQLQYYIRIQKKDCNEILNSTEFKQYENIQSEQIQQFIKGIITPFVTQFEFDQNKVFELINNNLYLKLVSLTNVFIPLEVIIKIEQFQLIIKEFQDYMQKIKNLSELYQERITLVQNQFSIIFNNSKNFIKSQCFQFFQFLINNITKTQSENQLKSINNFYLQINAEIFKHFQLEYKQTYIQEYNHQLLNRKQQQIQQIQIHHEESKNNIYPFECLISSVNLLQNIQVDKSLHQYQQLNQNLIKITYKDNKFQQYISLNNHQTIEKWEEYIKQWLLDYHKSQQLDTMTNDMLLEQRNQFFDYSKEKYDVLVQQLIEQAKQNSEILQYYQRSDAIQCQKQEIQQQLNHQQEIQQQQSDIQINTQPQYQNIIEQTILENQEQQSNNQQSQQQQDTIQQTLDFEKQQIIQGIIIKVETLFKQQIIKYFKCDIILNKFQQNNYQGKIFQTNDIHDNQFSAEFLNILQDHYQNQIAEQLANYINNI